MHCRFFRLISGVYAGNVVGLPLAGKVSSMFYRKDVFAFANLTVPNTVRGCSTPGGCRHRAEPNPAAQLAISLSAHQQSSQGSTQLLLVWVHHMHCSLHCCVWELCASASRLQACLLSVLAAVG